MVSAVPSYRIELEIISFFSMSLDFKTVVLYYAQQDAVGLKLRI